MLVQEYIADMTPSQLFVTYAGALSTVGGVSLVIFMSTGVILCILLCFDIATTFALSKTKTHKI